MKKKAQKLSEAILSFISRFTREHHYAPSIRDIQEELNISSTSVVGYHLDRLEEEGSIKRTGNTARSIVVTKKEGE